MSAENPYAAPEAKLTPVSRVSRDIPLARRFTRYLAAVVDDIIDLAYRLPILYLLGFFNDVPQGKSPPFWLLLVASVPGFLGFLLIHGYLLKTKGQTVGKLLLGIRITDLDGNVPEFGKVILLRYLPISIVSLIPVLGGCLWPSSGGPDGDGAAILVDLVIFPIEVLGASLLLLDVLFIFRGDRRCIHDLLAGTKVLMAEKGR
jgi:uncharacterized RDD family membrane protein YckC